MMLDFNAIASAIMEEFPYRWAYFQNLLPEKYCLELAKSYPQFGFKRVGDKSKNFLVLRLVGKTITEPCVLNDYWQELINDLCTSAYRVAMGNLTGLNLMDNLIHISFFCYDSGSSYFPHVDAECVQVVQVFYFNLEWNTDWGGYMRILKDQNPESVHQEIPPLLNTSVILARSDNSWHSVTPVTSDSPVSRQILKVVFLKREEYEALKASKTERRNRVL